MEEMCCTRGHTGSEKPGLESLLPGSLPRAVSTPSQAHLISGGQYGSHTQSLGAVLNHRT